MKVAKKNPKKRQRKILFNTTTGTITQSVFCILLFVYWELVYHIFTYDNVGDYILYPILFALPAGLLLLFVTGLFPGKVNQVILWVIMSFGALIYMVETVYQNIFKAPLMISDLGSGNLQVIVYYREIFTAITNCRPALLLILLPPVLFGILLCFGMKTTQKKGKLSCLYMVLMLFSCGMSVLAIHKSDPSKNNIYENYYDMYDTSTAMEYYGVLTTLRLNVQKILTGSDINTDDIITDDPIHPDDLLNKNPPTIDTSPNMLDIDFVSLAENESNADIKKLHQYYASLLPTYKNEYTGMFEGYNLIHITAEAFSPSVVDEELTPTLYKLVNTGFVFNNYYVPPTGESTCGGEFMNMTGLLTNPNRPNGTFTFQQTADNYMPYALGNVFNRLGVNSYAYHNNSLSYYNRIETIPNLGYIFKAAVTGKVKDAYAYENNLIFNIEHPNAWPQSDLEMMSVTGAEYITADNQFHAYYMTVSGHCNYSFTGNSMAYKNKDKVTHLTYSEACQAYIACNIELDLALENLIKQLEAAGVLDKTVICISSDHYPYGLTDQQINELAGKEMDTVIGRHKSNLILWNSAMEEPVIVDKVCSSIDVVPTLLNLFGIEYDSRLLAGKDILSDTDGFVWMTANNSFLYGNVIYNSKTRAVTDLDGNPIEISNEELSKMRRKGELMITMNQLLIENDYYNVIREYIE